MFVQTEAQSDPDLMRFLPGRTVLPVGKAAFADADAAADSPLARGLLAVDGVAAVVLEGEAVDIRKRSDVDWHVLKPPIFGVLMDHFADAADAGGAAEDARLAQALDELIGARIRPALAGDGGAIVLRGVTAGTASLELRGQAYDMPLFAMRVRIENTIRHFLPAVRGVQFVAAAPAPVADHGGAGLDSPEGRALRALLDDSINPAVAAHGGHIALIDVQDDTAFIRLEGGCQGCGMSDITLRHGVESAIRAALPSIARVVDVTDHDAGANPYFAADDR